MTKKSKIILAVVVIVLIVAGACAAIFMNKGEDTSVADASANTEAIQKGNDKQNSKEKDSSDKDEDNDVTYITELSSYSWKEGDGTAISLSGSTANITGSGAELKGKDIVISAGGQYEFSGELSDGRVLVDAKGEEVYIRLNGAKINCSYSSAIYVYKSKKTTVILKDGTENYLSDGGTYNFADDYSKNEEVTDEAGNTEWVTVPNACLYSKSDLAIFGAGKLTVNGNLEQGITGKDILEIDSSTIVVSTKGKGILGKDEIIARDVNISIVSQNDSLHSNGMIYLTNGSYNLESGDDGIHADKDVEINSSKVVITKSYEGIEGANVTLNSADINITSSDDGVNVNDKSGTLTIKDSDILVDAKGDGLDTNGSAAFDGGTIVVYGSPQGNNAGLDGGEGGSYTYTGGTMLIVDVKSMATVPTTSAIGMNVGLDTALKAGDVVKVTAGDKTYYFDITKNADHFTLVTPELKKGDTVTVTTGGTYTGTFPGNHLTTSGSYSGGTVVTTFTLEDGITNNGNTGGMGGHGMGGKPGMRGDGDNPGEFNGERPGGFNRGERGERPEGFNKDEMGERPEGFNKGEMGERPDFNGNPMEQPDNKAENNA